MRREAWTGLVGSDNPTSPEEPEVAEMAEQTGTKPKRGKPEPINVFPPLKSVMNSLADEDQILLVRLLTESPEFIDHLDFAAEGVDRTYFGVETRLTGPTATRFVRASPILQNTRKKSTARIPTLSGEQEKLIFKRFNYARRAVHAILTEYEDKRLTADATRKLLAWGHRAVTIRSQIVQFNLPLVLAMAKRTRLNGVDYNELISEGNIALLRSAEKFDWGRGFKFSTYACRAILKAFSRVAMRTSRYRGRFPVEYDPAMEKSDFLTVKREIVEEDCVDELKRILYDNSADLNTVEQTVIKERFAIGKPSIGGKLDTRTLEQVGSMIGVTKERVRQIQNRALQKIRVALEHEYLVA